MSSEGGVRILSPSLSSPTSDGSPPPADISTRCEVWLFPPRKMRSALGSTLVAPFGGMGKVAIVNCRPGSQYFEKPCS